MNKTVLIIGGGYGGLATANLFAKAGYAVTVIEKNDQFGGRTGQLQQDGFRFDTGPSWYLMPEVFEEYYQLFGLDVHEELSLTRLTPGYKVFYQSHDPLTLQGDVNKDAATFEAIEAGASEKLQKYVAASTETYHLSLKHFLYTNFDRMYQLLHKDILLRAPQFLALAATPLDRLASRKFKDLRIRQILEYHSVFLGGSPFELPALYSLMSTLDFKSGVYYPKNGMYSLVESLKTIGDSLGVTYRLNAPARRILVENGTARGVELENGETLMTDIVISNADLHHTETRLLEAPFRSYPEAYWKKKQPGPSALLVSLGIKGSLPTLEHHNLYFVDKWKENFEAIYDDKEVPADASIYICNPSKTDPTSAPEGHENVFILVPLPADKALTEEETNALYESSLAVLSDITNEPNLAERIVSKDVVIPQMFDERFNSWAYNALGGQSHLLIQSAFFRTRNKSKKVKNLYYSGASTTPGIGLPMCLISAQLVFKRVAGIHKNGPLRPSALEQNT